MRSGTPLQPGVVLDDRYRLLAPLGHGGMSQVWRAADKRLNRQVAVKVFDEDLDDPKNLARQETEVRALATLSHPNLVEFYDARHAPGPGERRSDSGHAYLVMELVDGPTLAQRVAQGPLRPAEVVDIARGVAGALAAAHSRGLVHRDVKPANILLTRDATGRTVPKLSDFGIAQRLGSARMTRTAMVVGTAAYLSPEQARGDEVGPPTDVYALGLVLLEALTGRREYDGPALQSAAARLSRGPRIPRSLPAPWPHLLASMTRLDPTDRPSASVVVGVLEGRAHIPVRRRSAAGAPAGLGGPATPVPPRATATPPPAPPEPLGESAWLPTAIFAVAVVAAIALIIAVVATR